MEPQQARSRRSALRAITCALAIAWVGCTSGTPRPEPEPPPSPVYTLDAEPAADTALPSESAPASAASYWRFVPLGPTPKPFPTDGEFEDLASRCNAAAPASDETDQFDQSDETFRSCFGDRGFYEAECSDGRDNDGDGLIDHASDPGCAEPHALSEAPECNDKRDNDGDGLADWDGAGFSHPDPECAETPSGRREAAPPKRNGLNPF
jgi:hypothetical protein